MEAFLKDILHSVRLFRRSPGFTIAAIAALALGIGANTAIFSVVNAVLLKPLTYPDPDRIVQFLLTSPQGSGPGASVTKFNVWKQQTQVFQEVAAYDFGGPGLNLTGGAFPDYPFLDRMSITFVLIVIIMGVISLSKPAKDLTRQEAAMIAACLPAPKRFKVKPPSRYVSWKAGKVMQQMNFLQPDPDIQKVIEKSNKK